MLFFNNSHQLVAYYGITHLLAELPDELPSLSEGIGGSQELDGQDRRSDARG